MAKQKTEVKKTKTEVKKTNTAVKKTKSVVSSKKGKISLRRGDIVLVDFGQKSTVKGSEQHGIRPAAILQNNTGNKFAPTTIVVPITKSTTKSKMPTHVHIEKEYLKNMTDAHDSIALLEQVRTIDKSRIIKHLGTHLKPELLKEVDKALLISIGLGGR